LTGDILDSKYRMLTRSVIQIWLMTLVITGIVVLIRGQVHDVLEIFRSFLRLYPGYKGWGIFGLAVGLVPVFTWKLLTDSMAPGLTGRRWISDGFVLVTAFIPMLLISAGVWYGTHPNLIARDVPIVFWTAAVVLIVKCVVAGVAFRVALDRGLMHRHSIVRILACGTVTAIATMLLFHLLLPAGSLPVPRPVALASTLTLLPLARFGLAPLALDWNRHG